MRNSSVVFTLKLTSGFVHFLNCGLSVVRFVVAESSDTELLSGGMLATM